MEEGRNNLAFAINGVRFEVSKIDPSTTLLEFIRTQTRYKGTKLSCGEGGCGACVVLLSKYDPVLEKVEDFTVSSCLTLLCSVNGCSITTTEGLGNIKDGYHPIHKRFSGFHASQCGFCTPGMCMSLFSALVNAEKTKADKPPLGFSKLTASEAEMAISGNLCRCTGYRPITDACKSFAADVDMEDLGLNSFWNKEKSEAVNVNKLPFYDPQNDICTFPDFLKEEIKSKNFIDSKVFSWHSPNSLEDLQSLLKSIEGETGTRVKLVVGNTGISYYKELDHYNKYIDLKHIPELSVMKRDSAGIEIGAAVSISKAIKVLKERRGESESKGEMIFMKIAHHMDKVASEFVRNTASLGGNLIMAQRNQFPSDIATVLLAADSSIEIQTGPKRLTLPLEDFLERPPSDSKTVLLSVKIPCWDPMRSVASGKSNLMFETYRGAPRPLGNSLPYLNAAFWANVSLSTTSNGFVLENLRLVFGAYGIKHAIRARKVEDFLVGKYLSFFNLVEAIKLVKEAVVPEEGTSHSAYRPSLAAGFLFDFLRPVVEASNESPRNILDGYVDTLEIKDPGCNRTNHIRKSDVLLSAKQVMEVSEQYHPVGEPSKKAGAEIQASGEAVFVDDIPSPKDCLHGAFICSTKPLAYVKDIQFQPPALPHEVIKVISCKDIPEGGENVGSKSIFGFEPLFADGLTEFAGQPLGIVVADTQRHADTVANTVVVKYDNENLKPPILSVEEAVERSSFIEVPPFLMPEQVGDFSKGMAQADHKILSAEIRFGSQYHFYMETQTALAVPDEDNCMVVYSSTQCPENAQIVIARCLGVPNHNVRVITRRVGGGFGGKALKALPVYSRRPRAHLAPVRSASGNTPFNLPVTVYNDTLVTVDIPVSDDTFPVVPPGIASRYPTRVAAACALASYKLQRPVRIYLNRKTDMIMAGGRHPMKINYSVGFKSNGKITALHLDILINGGRFQDISPIMPHNMLGALKKYDWGALSFDIKVCKTNHSSKTAMRAPGEVQASFIAEAVIEHVASFLSIEVDSIRNKNIHTFESIKFFYGDSSGELHEYTLPIVVDKLARSSNFHKRIDQIKQFNGCNIWKKRGISRLPIVHEVMLRPTPGKVSILNDGSVVVEVGGIELGQGLWTKVKQMAAFGLSLVECDGSKNLLERVRVIQADTLSLVQGGFTAGSTTSESSCEAVRLSCIMLVERLIPLKERLQKQMGTVSWDTLISQGSVQGVNLSASTYYLPGSSSARYLNYGAAVAEVEIDLLTGATSILQTDIIYDCGQSLNPAVDLGQIEGAFVQGIGFFMLEEYLSNSDGLVVTEGTWDYKIPTIDTIPRKFNVEILNSGHHQKRILSSKASGEPPLLLAASVHCAIRDAIRGARAQYFAWNNSDRSHSSMTFQLGVPATMPVVKELCGLDNVERYLQSLISSE
ncbi:hypothetical protein GIB67_034208 [Kingdonia uniflora]|uniref:Uncharacterized protein n=1 Tax=Kingdonia uniflora TaxID=39325 RepID=A0A7J7NRL0_9MAGN|nr:hypothetical protein GIB67_034208 [Kingdonia uniflora]